MLDTCAFSWSTVQKDTSWWAKPLDVTQSRGQTTLGGSGQNLL
jgi:hypothetical protein